MTKPSKYSMSTALRRAKALVGKPNKVGYCLAECVALFGLVGPWRWGGNGRAWAYNYWLAAVSHGKVVKTNNPALIPEGAMTFFAPRPGAKDTNGRAGHVAIKVGASDVISTDRPRTGRWGRVSIASIQKAWGKPLLGYIITTGEGVTLTDKTSAPPKVKMLESSLFTLNAHSKYPGWVARAGIIALRAIRSDASFLVFAELYEKQRPALDRLLADKYVLVAVNGGRCIYARRGRWALVPDSQRDFRVGPFRKRCVGVKLRHVETGKYLNVIGAHLSWKIPDGVLRGKETKSLIAQVKAAYPANRTLYAGDWNSSRKLGVRKADQVGTEMAKRGYRDAITDVAKPVNANYNSANRGLHPAPKDGVHLDRVFGGDLHFTSWRLDAYAPPYGSDHFGIAVRFEFPI